VSGKSPIFLAVSEAVSQVPQTRAYRPRLIAPPGYSQPEDRRRAEGAGFDEYLVKPVHSDAVRRLLAADTSA
jgi:CheY-like chemotaxis protein